MDIAIRKCARCGGALAEFVNSTGIVSLECNACFQVYAKGSNGRLVQICDCCLSPLCPGVDPTKVCAEID